MARPKKPIFGWGINDSETPISYRHQGKTVILDDYSLWHSMIRRSYSKYYQQKQSTYIDCEVDERWRLLSLFRKWLFSQSQSDWVELCLDKDYLSYGMTGKLYSPETCCFVPYSLNNLFTDHRSSRGPVPFPGVYFKSQHKSYYSVVSKAGKQKCLGYFNCQLKAFQVYREAKYEYAKSVLEEESPNLPSFVCNAVYRTIEHWYHVHSVKLIEDYQKDRALVSN